MRNLLRLMPALLLAVAAPAAADWLVTSSGEEIETVGEWQVKGALVVFKTADGRLNSLRAREVDLDASRERTAAPPAVEPEPVAEPVRQGPVLVITDADVAHVRLGGPEFDEPAGEVDQPAETGTDETEEETASVVEVVSWQERVDVQANALEVFGTVVNRGSSVVTDTRLEVRLLDGDGALLESRRANLSDGVLGPAAATSFSASFSGSPGFASIEFEVHSRGFRTQPAAQAPVDQ